MGFSGCGDSGGRALLFVVQSARGAVRGATCSGVAGPDGRIERQSSTARRVVMAMRSRNFSPVAVTPCSVMIRVKCSGTVCTVHADRLAAREISVRRVDQFIKALAANKSYSMAKQARTVLSLALGTRGQVRRLAGKPGAQHRRAAQATATCNGTHLSPGRRNPFCYPRLATRHGLVGPKPDGQLEQIIEVILGTSGRIGEVLAIRKCDVDVTVSSARARICGTIVSPTGKPTYRQSHPKPEKSTRVVAAPCFTAEVLRQ